MGDHWFDVESPVCSEALHRGETGLCSIHTRIHSLLWLHCLKIYLLQHVPTVITDLRQEAQRLYRNAGKINVSIGMEKREVTGMSPCTQQLVSTPNPDSDQGLT
ncbi:hypothetical protein P7K49_008919 [Saguinus oedipus]|uniref:Uncharacterized protein n=1 Tax=Saguinus oedipus TaxID=9490 RepID=A0ABQ9W1I4_SAGOE|nr:hypothetical protein P7K49_008919 [Saguinus oedipus]